MDNNVKVNRFILRFFFYVLSVIADEIEIEMETGCLCLQVRDDMAADGIEPLEEEIPYEDIIGRDYCRYNMKRLMGP